MAKTKEELQQLKQEFETLNSKLKELTEDELQQLVGGDWYDFRGTNNLNQSNGWQTIDKTTDNKELEVHDAGQYKIFTGVLEDRK